MADLPEINEWPEGIYQLETSDPVLGGPEGIDNLQAKQLANRTKWLKDQLGKIVEGVTAVGSAFKLTTPRAIKFKGAATGSGSFDGSEDLEVTLALANSGATAGSFDRVTVNEKGLVTAGSNSPVVVVSTSRTLTSNELGLVLIDSSAAPLTIQLPPADSALGVRDVTVRRADNGGNSLVIKAGGTDKIMLDTTTSSTGQASTELLFAGDYLHLRSDSTGKWWCVGQAQLPGSIASGLVSYQVAGNYAYTVPPVLRSGRRKPHVKVIGGGGSGRNSSTFGGGGGGGGVAEGLLDLTGVQTIAIAVGAGGPGAAYDASNGVGISGGTSSFGGYMSATGGAGGDASGQGGRSGNGVGGTLNYGLGDGQSGGRGATSTYGISGGGGGPGGSGVVVSAANASLTSLRNGQGPGGGGGGRMDNGGFSGAGHDGEVTIKW